MGRFARYGGSVSMRRAGVAWRGLACAGALLIAPVSAGAAALKLPDTPYNYTVIDQELGAALQEFGANLGIKLSISPEVKGRIQGRIPESKPQAFLDRLATNYNLEWYYDGSVLYITSAKENRTQLLVLSPIGYDALKGSLDALQISDPRFPLRPSPGKGVVMVSGPPRYVTLIEQTLAGLVAEEQARPKPSPAAPSVAAAAKAPPPPKVTVLTVYRGSGTTILRDGRPERVAGSESDSPAQSFPQPAANLPRLSVPAAMPGSDMPATTMPRLLIPGSNAPVPAGLVPPQQP